MESIDGILAAKLLIVFSLFWFGIYFLSCMLYSLFLKLKKENKNIKEKKDNFSLKALILFTKKCEKPTPLGVGWIAHHYSYKLELY